MASLGSAVNSSMGPELGILASHNSQPTAGGAAIREASVQGCIYSVSRKALLGLAPV